MDDMMKLARDDDVDRRLLPEKTETGFRLNTEGMNEKPFAFGSEKSM